MILDSKDKPVLREPLITWNIIQSKYPWGIMLLVGGSFGMAAGIEVQYDNYIILIYCRLNLVVIVD